MQIQLAVHRSYQEDNAAYSTTLARHLQVLRNSAKSHERRIRAKLAQAAQIQHCKRSSHTGGRGSSDSGHPKYQSPLGKQDRSPKSPSCGGSRLGDGCDDPGSSYRMNSRGPQRGESSRFHIYGSSRSRLGAPREMHAMHDGALSAAY